MKRSAFLLLLAALISLGGGCASLPYRYAPEDVEQPLVYRLQPGEPQLVRGRPHRFLDASDWIWPGSLISKLILWNARVDSHEITDETELILREYLARNHLRNVKVRLNAYSVKDEWHRTFRNRSIGPGWRYTLGFIAWLQYTILPGRFFGGDHYNPYSNTLNLYSDVPAIALHEGGHAKDFAGRTWKGTYAALYLLPVFPLYPEAVATSDAVSYLRETQPLALQKQGYNVLYPAYGTYVGGGAGEFFPPYYYPIFFAAVIPGHIAGRIRSATLDEQPQAQPPPAILAPPAEKPWEKTVPPSPDRAP